MHSIPWNYPNPVFRAISPRQDGAGGDGGVCLPTDMLGATPECAVSCILDFVRINYQDNACPFSSSLTYLCTSRTTSGLTIGEGSIQCLVSRCTGDDLTRIGVYNICDDVPGAIPRTISVITATIEPATSAQTMATPLPSKIDNPTATQEVTSIVMASGVPSMGPPATASFTATEPNSTNAASGRTVQPSVTGTSDSSTSTSSDAAVADKISPTPALSPGAIAGIGVGAGLTALIILALVLWRCRRRQKNQRRRSQRWSTHDARTPPPNYGSPPDLPVMTKAPDDRLLPVPSSNRRFYASVPLEEKRRSFWRRSIKPEEIGVAVTPDVAGTSSPTSLSSQRSMANLLPKVPEQLPIRASKSLWPAPLDLDIRQRRQSLSFRPNSVSTIFDEDLEANNGPRPPRISATRDSTGLTFPPMAKRSKAMPAPLQLNPISPDSFPQSSREPEQSPPATRIPLTPTYDNGNIVDNASRMYPPSSWRHMGPMANQISPPPLSALPEDVSPQRKAELVKNVLRKKTAPPTTNMPVGLLSKDTVPDSKPGPTRKDSETTAGTEIEEDTTPEEVERQLEMRQKPKPTPIAITRIHEGSNAPRSPISNLKYPPIPRSAGISRQAEYVPRLLQAAPVSPVARRPVPARPKRDQLVRNDSSFMVTDTTSSDGYLSDHSIEWPVPPAPRGTPSPLKTDMSRLRENPASANRGVGKHPVERSLDQVLQYGPRSSSLLAPPASSKVQLSPNTSQGAGDLYFTVEM